MKYTCATSLFYIWFVFANGDKIIKNANIPACKHCIHYRPSLSNTDFTNYFNTCGKFGEKDIVSGKITYKKASSCRGDETICGVEGKHFIEEPNLQLKMLKHGVLSNIPNGTMFISLLSLLINCIPK